MVLVCQSDVVVQHLSLSVFTECFRENEVWMGHGLRPMEPDPFPKEPELEALELKWFRTRREARKGAPEMLVHCTGTAEAVVGMAASGQMWATDVRFLNDRAAVRHGIDLPMDLLQNEPNPASQVGKDLFAFLGTNLPRGLEWVQVFVVCLCRESDVANQWFTYADKGRALQRADSRD